MAYDYLFAYFTPPNKFGNIIYNASSKIRAIKLFQEENKNSIIINIIEL